MRMFKCSNCKKVYDGRRLIKTTKIKGEKGYYIDDICPKCHRKLEKIEGLKNE